jgi:hypothetical protein
MLERVADVLTLDDRTYEAIRHNPRATRQALILVFLATAGAGVTRLDSPVVWQLVSPVLSVLFRVIGAWYLFLIGTRLLDAPAPDGDWIQPLRLTGFVQVTSLVKVLKPVDVVGPLHFVLYIAGVVWGLALAVKAAKLVPGVGTRRAIAESLLVRMPLGALAAPIYLTLRHVGLA